MSVVSIKRFPNKAIQVKGNASSFVLWDEYTYETDWTDADGDRGVLNIKTNDGIYIYNYLDGDALSYGSLLTWVIRVSDFGFYIPSYAEIKGIEVKVKRFDYGTENINSSVIDETVSLMINGVKTGDNKADIVSAWPSSATIKTYGSPTDLWGLDLTSDSFNTKFGVEFQAKMIIGNADDELHPRIDYIAVIIYYDKAFPQPEPPEYTALDQSDKIGKKTWFARIYDQEGNFKSEVTMNDFVTPLYFSNEINGYASEMILKLNHSFNDLRYPENGEITVGGNAITTYKGVDRIYNGIRPGYYIKFFVSDKEIINKQIYSGIIAGIRFKTQGNNEEMEVSIIPYSSLCNNRILRSDEGSTTYAFSKVFPRDMITDIIDNSGLTISYDTDTMKEAKVRRSYTFNANKVSEAIKKAVQLCPFGWYSYIDGKDYLYFKKYPTNSSSHIIHKNNAINLEIEKNITGITNRIYFLGGGTPQLFQRYDKTGSQKSWGLYETIYNDERVTDEETAELLSKNKLSATATPVINFTVEIMDSNLGEGGYDIESINLGDMVTITTDDLDKGSIYWNEFNWGQDYWAFGINSIYGVKAFIERIDYKFHSVVLHCRFGFPGLAERIEDINKDLIEYRTKDAPELST